MLIGGDLFGGENCSMFTYDIYHAGEHSTELRAGLVDHLYMTADSSLTFGTAKQSEWTSRTILKADFDNTIEAGSIVANNMQIDSIKFQKREIDQLEWQDVATLNYGVDNKIDYMLLDKNIKNSFTYEYSMLPIASSIVGRRILSRFISADFEGVFLSDKDNNYKLSYNLDFGTITSNTGNNVFEPLNSTYPIVVHSNLDYATFDITALFLTTGSLRGGGRINIGEERKGKDRLMKFMKNKKPKVYRDENGVSKLVSVVGNPTETVWNNPGLAALSFSMVEIGDTDGDTLKENNILEWE